MAYDYFKPLYSEYFIEVFLINYKFSSSEEGLFLYFLSNPIINYYNTNFYSQFCDEICIGYDLMKFDNNIVESVINSIKNDSYIIIFHGYYNIFKKNRENNDHFVHELLVYGYDNLEKKFLTVDLMKIVI